MTRSRRWNDFLKTLKDYTVPLIALFLILILFYNIFSSDSSDVKDVDTIQNIQENNIISWVKISLNQDDTKAYITYKNGKKVEITWDTSLEKWEKIEVEKGSVSIDFPLLAKTNLAKNWELLYNEDWNIELLSNNLWIEALWDLTITMKYADVDLKAWNIANLYQTAIESFIYDIDWDITVSNKVWVSIILSPEEKTSIKAKDKDNSEFTFTKDKISFFKTSPWFIENWWDKILAKQDKQEDMLSQTSTWILNDNIWENWKNSNLVSFDNLKDEWYSEKNIINITWKFDWVKVGKITINNINVKLNKALWIFSLNNFSLNNKVNDLVIKIFDNNGNILEKQVITIYTKQSIQSKNNTNLSSKLENFAVKPSDFIIYKPSKTGKFTTTWGQVTIRWIVKNKNVASVLVNDYKLKSFNGSTWRYHAFVDQWTLKDWTNIYEIKYIWKDGKIIYKDYFTIYKTSFKQINQQTKKISDEAKL